MKRIRRWIFSAMIIASGLAWIAVVVLWVRSGRYQDSFGYEGAKRADGWQRGAYVDSSNGNLSCEWWIRQDSPGYSPPVVGWSYGHWHIRGADGWSAEFKYDVWTYEPAPVGSSGGRPSGLVGYAHEMEVPDWFVLAVVSIPPIIGIAYRLRRRRIQRLIAGKRCAACGYDLRATPDRCPECGMVVHKDRVVAR
jgi:hypothetical protein